MLEAIQLSRHAIGTEVKHGHELKHVKSRANLFQVELNNALPAKITKSIIIVVIAPRKIYLKFHHISKGSFCVCVKWHQEALDGNK